ncbi:hypothetical protein [Actinomadura flavalba]|uniref:hypothetical protein n=1 Tax=Actinomadura flavalba TaxID=1120938 RepID=UPI000363AC8A|nr:hypothetical protein [Actinomadura flavalba]
MAFLPPPSQLPAPPPGAPPRPRPPTNRRLGLTARAWALLAGALAVLLLVTTCVALGAGYREYTRAPTAAEVERAANAEVARRWRTWATGRVFPDVLRYRAGDKTEEATRLGVVPGTECAEAVDSEIGSVLDENGCRAVLRATYADRLQGVVTTIGVVALPDPQRADRALRALPQPADTPNGAKGPAVRAAAFPGTASARFNDAARQGRTQTRAGPYLVLTTSGQSDGRAAAAIVKSRPGRLFAHADQLAAGVLAPLAARGLPRCGAKEWTC